MVSVKQVTIDLIGRRGTVRGNGRARSRFPWEQSLGSDYGMSRAACQNRSNPTFPKSRTQHSPSRMLFDLNVVRIWPLGMSFPI